MLLVGVVVSPSPAQARELYGVVYKSTETVDVKLDIYVPSGPGPFPAVVLVHGGSWKTNWRGEFQTTARKFLKRKVASYVVDFRMPCKKYNPGEGVDPNLCHYPFPTPVEDIQDAVRWVRAHGHLFNTITDKVGIMGSSTGGNLAMEVGVSGIAGDTRPDAIVAWSGLGDLTFEATSAHNRNNYVGCTYNECPEKWIAASPSRNVDPGDAPLYLSGSEFELAPTADEQQLTITRWTAAGVDNYWHFIPGSDCHSRECWGVDPEIINESAAWIWQWIGS
jgi:acetyl esterase/lipase